jgi:hypothetical protein
VVGVPKLFKRTCVLSNLNLKISFGPAAALVQTVSGKLHVGQLTVGVGVGSGVGSAVALSFFLQERKINKNNVVIIRFFIFAIFVKDKKLCA